MLENLLTCTPRPSASVTRIADASRACRTSSNAELDTTTVSLTGAATIVIRGEIAV